MKIFVTGGTGFIGSHFINQAHQKQFDLVVLKKENSKPRVKLLKSPFWVVGNMNENWCDELESCDAFVHFASYGVVRDNNNWDKCFKVNLIDSLNLWRQAIAVGIKKFIIIGSCFEYGLSGIEYNAIPSNAPLLPKDAYSSSKASATIAAISLCIEYKLDLTVLRPFHVYGEGEDKERFWPTLLRSSKEGKDLEMTMGEQIRDFQYVGQTVKDILFHLQKESTLGVPRIVNIGSGKPKTLLQFANEEWKRLGSKGKILNGKKAYRKNEIMRFVPKL